MTIEDVGMGLYDALRKVAVMKGYLPDITDYLPNDEAGYIAAKKAIGANLIDVIGGGQWRRKQNKDEDCIVVNFVYPMPSKIGRMGQYTNVPDGDRFKVIKEADTLFDLYFQVVYMTRDERVITRCEQLIAQTFGRIANLKAFNLDGEITGEFAAIRNEPFDVSTGDYYERGYRFCVEGIDLIGGVEVGSVSQFSAFELQLHTEREKLVTDVIGIKVYETLDNSEVILTTEEGDEMDFLP